MEDNPFLPAMPRAPVLSRNFNHAVTDPRSVGHTTTSVVKPTFAYKEYIKQKIVPPEQPRKFIRNNLDVSDITNGQGMGKWSDIKREWGAPSRNVFNTTVMATLDRPKQGERHANQSSKLSTNSLQQLKPGAPTDRLVPNQHYPGINPSWKTPSRRPPPLSNENSLLGQRPMLGRSLLSKQKLVQQTMYDNQFSQDHLRKPRNPLENSDIPGSFVDRSKRKVRNHDAMDYSDVTKGHVLNKRYRSPNLPSDLKPEQIMPHQLQLKMAHKARSNELLTISPDRAIAPEQGQQQHQPQFQPAHLHASQQQIKRAGQPGLQPQMMIQTEYQQHPSTDVSPLQQRPSKEANLDILSSYKSLYQKCQERDQKKRADREAAKRKTFFSQFLKPVESKEKLKKPRKDKSLPKPRKSNFQTAKQSTEDLPSIKVSSVDPLPPAFMKPEDLAVPEQAFPGVGDRDFLSINQNFKTLNDQIQSSGAAFAMSHSPNGSPSNQGNQKKRDQRKEKEVRSLERLDRERTTPAQLDTGGYLTNRGDSKEQFFSNMFKIGNNEFELPPDRTYELPSTQLALDDCQPYEQSQFLSISNQHEELPRRLSPLPGIKKAKNLEEINRQFQSAQRPLADKAQILNSVTTSYSKKKGPKDRIVDPLDPYYIYPGTHELIQDTPARKETTPVRNLRPSTKAKLASMESAYQNYNQGIGKKQSKRQDLKMKKVRFQADAQKQVQSGSVQKLRIDDSGYFPHDEKDLIYSRMCLS